MSNQTPLKKGFKQLVAEANANVQTIPPADALQRHNHADVLFVDIRDLPELQRDGKIPGAIHASRGMLEFYADPESPYHLDAFSADKQIMLYCASGGRSALAAQRLQEMGFTQVAHIAGGLKAWKEANGPVETL